MYLACFPFKYSLDHWIVANQILAWTPTVPPEFGFNIIMLHILQAFKDEILFFLQFAESEKMRIDLSLLKAWPLFGWFSSCCLLGVNMAHGIYILSRINRSSLLSCLIMSFYFIWLTLFQGFIFIHFTFNRLGSFITHFLDIIELS